MELERHEVISYKLRKATPDDFMLSYEIRKNALGKYVYQTWGWDEQWQLKYHKEDFDINILSIIEVNGEPAGSLELIEEKDAVKVSGLYITDKYQNHGIGRSIMQDIINNSKSDIKLQVLKVNSRAKKFYESLGFKVYDETENHYQMLYKNGK